jgi:hypothetical protein
MTLSLFRRVPATGNPEKSLRGKKQAIRTLAVTLERETVTVMRPAGAPMVDAENRCLCCGQVVPAPLSVCAAHATVALPSTTSVTPALLQQPTPTNDTDEVK